MSIPIRPPGGPPIMPGVSGVEGASEVQPGQAVDVGAVSGAERTASSQAAEAAGPTADVLARLDAGELTREQAIESLVAKALEMHGGARLPAAQRDELTSVLRSALLHDPALGRLLGGD